MPYQGNKAFEYGQNFGSALGTAIAHRRIQNERRKRDEEDAEKKRGQLLDRAKILNRDYGIPVAQAVQGFVAGQSEEDVIQGFNAAREREQAVRDQAEAAKQQRAQEQAQFEQAVRFTEQADIVSGPFADVPMRQRMDAAQVVAGAADPNKARADQRKMIEDQRAVEAERGLEGVDPNQPLSFSQWKTLVGASAAIKYRGKSMAQVQAEGEKQPKEPEAIPSPQRQSEIAGVIFDRLRHDRDSQRARMSELPPGVPDELRQQYAAQNPLANMTDQQLQTAAIQQANEKIGFMQQFGIDVPDEQAAKLDAAIDAILQEIEDYKKQLKR